jgi:hypothetical protein
MVDPPNNSFGTHVSILGLRSRTYSSGLKPASVMTGSGRAPNGSFEGTTLASRRIRWRRCIYARPQLQHADMEVFESSSNLEGRCRRAGFVGASSREYPPQNKPREIPIVFPLQFRLLPICAGDQLAAGLAATLAFHFVGLVIGHRVVDGQLLASSDIPDGNKDNLTLQSQIRSQEWFSCIMPPARSLSAQGSMKRSPVIWTSEGPSASPIRSRWSRVRIEPPFTTTTSPFETAAVAKRPRPSIGLNLFATFGEK